MQEKQKQILADGSTPSEVCVCPDEGVLLGVDCSQIQQPLVYKRKASMKQSNSPIDPVQQEVHSLILLCINLIATTKILVSIHWLLKSVMVYEMIVFMITAVYRRTKSIMTTTNM